MATTFREALGKSESGGDYTKVNDLGYTGKFQWGEARLADFNKAMGTNFTLEDLKNSPKLQEQAQAWHENDIMDYVFNRGLDYYLGKTVDGVPITPQSIIAMSHIGGKDGMATFLESGGRYNPSDEYGTSIRDYGLKFSGLPSIDDGKYGHGDVRFDDSVPKLSPDSTMSNLLTAYEMMQGPQHEPCPPGHLYDPLTQSCVPASSYAPPRPKAREAGSPLDNFAASAMPRPQPRPLGIGVRPQPRPAGLPSLTQ